MNILITGATGFVGSYFCANYADSYSISKFSFSNDSLDNLDLRNTEKLIHLSAIVHQMHKVPDEDYYKVNVTNTLSLAHKAKSSGVRHFIFISTVKVFGEETDVPYSETSPCNPQDAYGRTKLAAEKGLLAMADDSFIVSIIRPPLVYGYGVKANMNSLVKLVKKFKIIPLGNIKNRRSIVFVGNLANMIDALIKNPVTGIFLVADDNPLSTSDMLRITADTLGKNIILPNAYIVGILLKLIKPAYHRRLFMSLALNADETYKRLGITNKYSTAEGFSQMTGGQDS